MWHQPKNSNKAIIITLSALTLLYFAICLNYWFFNKTNEINVTANNTYTNTIKVVADYDYEPYSFCDEDGKAVGYDVEFVNAIANEIHLNVELKFMSWNDAKASVLNGEADLLLGLGHKPEALPDFALSVPILSDPFVAFGKENFSKISDLYGCKIAAMKNSESYPAFLNPYNLEENTTAYHTYRAAFESVENGTNDYAIARYSVGRRAVAKIEDSLLSPLGPELAHNKMCYGVRADNLQLMDEINDAIIKLTNNGTVDKLADKWLGSYVQVITFRDFVAANSSKILLVIAVIAIVFIFVFAKRAHTQRERLTYIVEYQKLLSDSVKGMYENIFDFDLTRDRAGDTATQDFFVSLGIRADTPFSEALLFMANQIHPSYVSGYLNVFARDNVLAAFKNGITRFEYECLVTNDNARSYCWMRVSTRSFYWGYDKSVRMISYRQNIDDVKRNELQLIERAQCDPLTGVYNKRATEEASENILLQSSKTDMHAMLILDIDNFKGVNDNFGHAFGDFVICEFAKSIRQEFSEENVVGRIGGDEFLILLKNIISIESLTQQADSLVALLHREFAIDANSCAISASIGIALYDKHGTNFSQLFAQADRALYKTKENGKNGFTIAE